MVIGFGVWGLSGLVFEGLESKPTAYNPYRQGLGFRV